LNETRYSTALSSKSYTEQLKSIVRRCTNYAPLLPLKQQFWGARNCLNTVRLKSASITKDELIKDIRNAITACRGYATAKIGISQKYWMYYEIFLSQRRDPAEIRNYEKELKIHALKQEGLYPENCDFYLAFNRFYMNHVRNLDCLGVCYRPSTMEMQILRYYKLHSKLIYFEFQEPDRTDQQCYLPYFRDKKLLIICPFAAVLKSQATKEIFEGVWSKTGKKWFYPKSVDAVEFPYGFAQETHQKYSTVMDLFDFIIGKINQKDFDVALVAAGGLSIPIASTIKNMGKVAIDLGGHLQFVFGVLGKRWRDSEDGKRNYYNDFWIDMPARYKPKETDVCDNGAYW